MSFVYVVPHGRVAYWADWRMWGLSRTQWAELHINLGVLLLLAIIIHCWYNWPVITSYLKNKARNLNIFTASFNIALFLSLLFCLGTYFQIPPLSTIITVSTALKDRATKTYGEPPYGHAELSSLKIFAKKTELDLDASLVKLKDAGISIKNTEQTLAEIAKINHTTPKNIYALIKPAPTDSLHGLPASPPSGLGRLTLAELCSGYRLDCDKLQAFLAGKGFASSPDSTIKDIGSKYNRNPHDIYDLLAEHFKASD